jgi:hypothetical protein
MQTPVVTNTADELVIRKHHYQHLAGALISTVLLIGLVAGPYEKSRIIFKENLFVAILLTLGLVIGAIYCWYSLFDRSVKIVINKKGIWTKKTGLITWDCIQYYYFGLIEGDVTIYLLYIKLHTAENEVQIDISYAGNTRSDLASAIEQHSSGYTIYNLSEDQYH